jgi:hypothetical protein
MTPRKAERYDTSEAALDVLMHEHDAGVLGEHEDDVWYRYRDGYVQAALSGSATGITKEFGVFTYSNTNPALRAALPRDPAEFPADASGFSTETGLAAGLSNFTAVAGLGSVAAGSIVLIPEPTSVSLLLLGLGCVAVARRKTVQTTNSIR